MYIVRHYVNSSSELLICKPIIDHYNVYKYHFILRLKQKVIYLVLIVEINDYRASQVLSNTQ